MKSDSPSSLDKDKIPWVAGLVVLGLAALVISFFLQKKSSAERDSLYRIGQVEKQRGNVWIFRAGLDQKKKVEKSVSVSPLDTIEVEDGSEARLIFENTAVLRLMSESLFTFERVEIEEGIQDVVFIQRGDLKVEDSGRDGELFISKNGQRVAAKLYNESKLAAEQIQKPVLPDISEASSAGLSDDEISTLVTAQRPNFMKCYMNLLQKEPQSKGEVSMNFTIENSGKVGLIEISSVQLRQEDFKKCLSEVLSRIQFRSFSGTPISTFFPLKFE